MKRIIIHTKDVMIITGRSERHARELINQVKKALEKEPHQYLTISEFCNHYGLNSDEVRKELL